MEADYWNSYYSECSDKSVRQVPSQFAAFVLGELSGGEQIFEFGCGFGRDSFFFNSFGFDIVGVDGSDEAIAQCEKRANGRAGIRFYSRDITDKTLGAEFSKMRKPDTPAMIYARFFLHAIDDQAQTTFMAMAQEICKPADRMALEFRTDKDEAGIKETASHYRRFVKADQVIALAERNGFRVVYSVEGLGFAKYKSDDAHVARIVLEKA